MAHVVSSAPTAHRRAWSASLAAYAANASENAQAVIPAHAQHATEYANFSLPGRYG
eukprot:CAMPEP_0177715062 /NCGR_PEP_ID=MMETSP0484_2-20121128/13787_1 /TAXON_ID=354590 /ORGANISM="Rhodomonas lens, Strain RHODO" /LENGTH=55 /DNA_ID=CAMNT_0019227023 /DNA_START=256 /DNA_END=423 /DNA_ORIENTATION=+